MAKTADYRLGEFTFPRGWFMIAQSHELTHKPLALRYFGRDFALYRGLATGRVVLLDAYCPHMQTHLGAHNTTSYVVIDNRGTNIVGDDIVCPYHAWKFGPDGKCNEIPYHDGPIPEAARVKSWPVHESLGAIWIWHDPEGNAPLWPAPDYPEHSDATWVQPNAYDDFGTLAVHQAEVIDNICDYAHFSPIHGAVVSGFDNSFKGHIAVQRQSGTPKRMIDPKTGQGPTFSTVAEYHGPGFLSTRISGIYTAIILICHTPVDDGSLRVWHTTWMKSPEPMPAFIPQARIVAEMFQETSRLSFAQDFEIWRHKAPNILGMYLPSDGPFLKARQWYKQFYNPLAKQSEYLEGTEGQRWVPKGAKAVVM